MMHAVNKHIPTVKHTLLDALNEKENSTKNPKKKKNISKSLKNNCNIIWLHVVKKRVQVKIQKPLE